MRAKIARVGIEVLFLLTGFMVGTHTANSIHAKQRVNVPAAYGRVVAGDGSIVHHSGSKTRAELCGTSTYQPAIPSSPSLARDRSGAGQTL